MPRPYSAETTEIIMRCEPAATSRGLVRLSANAVDAIDRFRAERARRSLGRRAWLVSWDQPAGASPSWTVRLSCPEWPSTIARRGRSRCEALRRAREALERLCESDAKP